MYSFLLSLNISVLFRQKQMFSLFPMCISIITAQSHAPQKGLSCVWNSKYANHAAEAYVNLPRKRHPAWVWDFEPSLEIENWRAMIQWKPSQNKWSAHFPSIFPFCNFIQNSKDEAEEGSRAEVSVFRLEFRPSVFVAEDWKEGKQMVPATSEAHAPMDRAYIGLPTSHGNRTISLHQISLKTWDYISTDSFCRMRLWTWSLCTQWTDIFSWKKEKKEKKRD